MRITAQEVYDKLMNDDQITSITGQIRFHLGNVDIIVRQRDVVGNIIQEWLEGWLSYNDIDFAKNFNTQMPPDIFLNPDDKKTDLLEIKAFNYKAAPGFDIADFTAFQAEIIDKPYMLNAKYLIFGYEMKENGDVVIRKLWLKDLWAICRPMKNWALNMQVKKGVVHKIRPAKWYSQGKSDFKPFRSLEDFLSALEECIYQNPATHNVAANWKQRMISSYKNHYDIDLNIERWNDIKHFYLK